MHEYQWSILERKKLSCRHLVCMTLSVVGVVVVIVVAVVVKVVVVVVVVIVTPALKRYNNLLVQCQS